MRVLVLQSCHPAAQAGWQGRCIESVRAWTAARGYQHRLLGDELFDVVPAWYRDKVGAKLPVAADYARLVLLGRALDEEGFDRAWWFDADTLVFDASMCLDFKRGAAFGQELWIQQDQRGRWRGLRNVHNAVCGFDRGNVVLPFLRETVLSLVRRVDARHIAPQFVGPKLLTALHNLADFELLPQAGALSPPLVRDLALGGGEALAAFRRLQRPASVPLAAANLCASLVDPRHAERALRRLLEEGPAALD